VMFSWAGSSRTFCLTSTHEELAFHDHDRRSDALCA
jgi:hypothetical protein